MTPQYNDGSGRRERAKRWLHAQFVAPLFAPMGGSERRSFRGRRGVALILALLFIVLLTVLVVEFSYETQVDASLAENSNGDLEAYLAARSGVARGMGMLWDHLVEFQEGLNNPPTGNTSGSNGFSNSNNSTGNLPPGGASEPYDSKYDEWYTGIPFEQLNDNSTMRVSISDEYGKINLNALLIPGQNGGQPQERQVLVNVLRAFFAARYNTGDSKGGSAAFDPTDAILDWVDYGEDENERTDGAEDDYYMGLENPYHCKNGPMDSIEELLLIKGITPKIYFGNKDDGQLPLSEYLTVNGHWGGAINVNTAQEDVINAVFDAGSQDGTLQRINPAQLQQIQEQLSQGPIYTRAQLGGLAWSPTGNNNGNAINVDRNGDGIDDNTGQRFFVDKNNDGKDDFTGQPASAFVNRDTNQNRNNGNRNGGVTRTSMRVAPSGVYRELRAELPRPQAILVGLYTPYAVLSAPGVTRATTPTVMAQFSGFGNNSGNNNGGNNNGNGNNNGGNNNGGNNNNNNNGRGTGQGGGLFVIDSNCFRIYGDGMEGDVLVRIECYVWRNSPFLNPNEIQQMIPPQMQQNGPWQPPAENFRILDWKVIR